MRVVRSALVVALLIPAALTAQAKADPATNARLRGMASDLRNFVTAQEAYFAEQNRYAPDLAALGAKFKTSTGHTLELLVAGTNGWGASIRAAGAEGDCVIFVNLPASQRPRTAIERKVFPEGEPACDGDGEVEAKRWASAATFTTERVMVAIAKAQERLYGKTGAYAPEAAQLEGVRANDEVQVTIEITPAGARGGPGYLVIARHTRYPEASCVLRSGWGPWGLRAMTAVEKRRPVGELQPTCDSFAR